MTAGIKPEDLLSIDDYIYWKNNQSNDEPMDTTKEYVEVLSRKSWATLLLQVLKVSLMMLYSVVEIEEILNRI